MATSLQHRHGEPARPPGSAPAEAAALADRLATALEAVAGELARIRVLLEGASGDGAAQARADSGPWLRRAPTADDR